MKHLGFLVDVSKCLGCRACEVACKNYYRLGERQRYRRVQELERVTDSGVQLYYLSLACNHCESPECIRVCPNRTYHKRRDGIVVHDPGRCDGCCSCVKACPYGAPQFDEVSGKVDKCDLCLTRLNRGERPVCEEACNNGALQMVDLAELNEATVVKTVPGLANISLTRPAVRFFPPCNGKQWLRR